MCPRTLRSFIWWISIIVLKNIFLSIVWVPSCRKWVLVPFSSQFQRHLQDNLHSINFQFVVWWISPSICWVFPSTLALLLSGYLFFFLFIRSAAWVPGWLDRFIWVRRWVVGFNFDSCWWWLDSHWVWWVVRWVFDLGCWWCDFVLGCHGDEDAFRFRFLAVDTWVIEWLYLILEVGTPSHGKSNPGLETHTPRKWLCYSHMRSIWNHLSFRSVAFRETLCFSWSSGGWNIYPFGLTSSMWCCGHMPLLVSSWMVDMCFVWFLQLASGGCWFMLWVLWWWEIDEWRVCFDLDVIVFCLCETYSNI